VVTHQFVLPIEDGHYDRLFLLNWYPFFCLYLSAQSEHNIDSIFPAAMVSSAMVSSAMVSSAMVSSATTVSTPSSFLAILANNTSLRIYMGLSGARGWACRLELGLTSKDCFGVFQLVDQLHMSVQLAAVILDVTVCNNTI